MLLQVSLPLNLDLDQPLPGFDSIESALQDLAQGRFVVVIDDENRENEGDLIINADKMTTESMHFMIEYTSGVICISMEARDMERLKLPLMVSSAENEEAMYTAFTVTVDLKEGITTGISASDRTKTILRMANPNSTSAEFNKPGHIFPLRYRPGGVIVRPGHTEAAVDLARLSGSYPSGVLCELVNKSDGSMSRTPELLAFAKQHGLKCITIADLIRYRLRHEQVVQHVASAPVASAHGLVTAHSFRSMVDNTEHLAFVAGDVLGASETLLHVHEERSVADLLGAVDPSTSTSLPQALQRISQAGSGVIIYSRGQTSRSLQPSTELHAAAAASTSTSAASLYRTDLREMGAAAQMLKHLGVSAVQLLGQGPNVTAWSQGLSSCGIAVSLAGPDATPSAGHAAGNGAESNGHHHSLQPTLSGARL